MVAAVVAVVFAMEGMVFVGVVVIESEMAAEGGQTWWMGEKGVYPIGRCVEELR